MMNLPEEIKAGFLPREKNANKFSVGTVTVVGGSSHYIHAPVIAGLGARAAGAGLVQLVVPNASRIAAAALVPEATVTKLTATFMPPRADVTVIGMGLGLSTMSEAIVSRLLSGSCGRFVLDADALTILAKWYGRTDGYAPAKGQELILTPHEGEAARLLGVTREEVAANRPTAAREMAERYGATVILKGANTLVVSSDGTRTYENKSGNPFMAMGGMGDLLAGTLGARWAYLKTDPFLAATSSVWLHATASDRLIDEARDPSIVATAASIGSLRVMLDC